MEGVIWHIYRRQEKGMIRGNDGLQLPFRKSALNGVEFPGLCSGQRVSYLIQEGWLGREAVNVHPLPADQPPENEQLKSQVSTLQKENTELRGHVDELTTARDGLTKENDALKAENEALKAKTPSGRTSRSPRK